MHSYIYMKDISKWTSILFRAENHTFFMKLKKKSLIVEVINKSSEVNSLNYPWNSVLIA